MRKSPSQDTGFQPQQITHHRCGPTVQPQDTGCNYTCQHRGALQRPRGGRVHNPAGGCTECNTRSQFPFR
ncbi:hypothetical protein D3H65_32425 [Paraflavitalea soli]|uniref:Uncharacterized protein n=1 Tax=Paraflavitalea soli TaxID=2315862 RepID=A0A3B7MXZ3_9BACT|nr:hypothetical protein D3H65_32425 [Paraflavitalea soli]